MRTFCILLCAGALGACAALSERQCRSGDWAALGERDGRAGDSAQRLHEYRDACGRYGVTPNEAEYRAGRVKGLAAYCTPAAIFASARQGQTLSEGCPAKDHAALTEAQRRGSELARVESDLLDLQSTILRLEDWSLRQNLTEAERRHARALLLRLYREQHRLELLAWRMETAFRVGRPAPPYFGQGLIY